MLKNVAFKSSSYLQYRSCSHALLIGLDGHRPSIAFLLKDDHVDPTYILIQFSWRIKTEHGAVLV